MSHSERTLEHLRALVGHDTRNPPRKVRAGEGVYRYLREVLSGLRIREWDHGDGSVSLLAERGRPDTLFNFHVDTVPRAEGWARDPFSLGVEAERAYGLGACDIKGALACMLSAVVQTSGPVAILVTSDEEAGSNRCIKAFLAEAHGYRRAIVAEPTGGRAVTAHRSAASVRVRFGGISGHASEARALTDNAIHRAARWAVASLEHAAGLSEQGFDRLRGVRLNIGKIEGGIKPNMIAASAQLRFGLRGLPGEDVVARLESLRALAPEREIEDWEVTWLGPALPDGSQGEEALHASRSYAEQLDLPPGPAVDFWTEAALFSAVGMPAIVFGSGDIAQAHTADEWVALSQLDLVTGIYVRLIEDGQQ